jgi:hypothetical protein
MQEFFIDLQNDYKERFAMGKFMEFIDDNFDPLTSFMLNSLKDLKPKGRLKVDGTAKRPDVLAYQTYGDVQYWWVLMCYNGWLSVDDIINGEEFNYPDIAELDDLYFTLKIRQG